MSKKLVSILIFCVFFSLGLGKKQSTETSTTAVPADNVWVGISDEAKACAIEKGIALEKSAAILTQAQITVYAKKKLHDGQIRIQTCDIDKGDMNAFLIAKKDVERAKELGFKLVPRP